MFCLLARAALQHVVQQQLPQAQVVLFAQEMGFLNYLPSWQQVQGYKYLCYLSLIPPTAGDNMYRYGIVDSCKCTNSSLGDLRDDLTMLHEQPGIGIICLCKGLQVKGLVAFCPMRAEAKPYLQLAPQLDQLTFGKPSLWLCSAAAFLPVPGSSGPAGNAAVGRDQ